MTLICFRSVLLGACFGLMSRPPRRPTSVSGPSGGSAGVLFSVGPGCQDLWPYPPPPIASPVLPDMCMLPPGPVTYFPQPAAIRLHDLMGLQVPDEFKAQGPPQARQALHEGRLLWDPEANAQVKVGPASVVVGEAGSPPDSPCPVSCVAGLPPPGVGWPPTWRPFSHGVSVCSGVRGSCQET